jgi:hypothetical protein
MIDSWLQRWPARREPDSGKEVLWWEIYELSNIAGECAAKGCVQEFVEITICKGNYLGEFGEEGNSFHLIT